MRMRSAGILSDTAISICSTCAVCVADQTVRSPLTGSAIAWMPRVSSGAAT